MKLCKALTFFLALTVVGLSLTGCASFGQKLKAFLNGSPPPSDEPVKEKPMSFEQNPNVYTGPRRQYRRMTKKTFQEEAQLEDEAGSLWVMEGQGAYLFSQNIIRMVGDPIGVKIDGEPREQLETKVKVIRRLLRKLEAPAPPPVRNPASQAGAQADGAQGGEGASADESKQVAQKPAPKPAAPEPTDVDFNVHTVPTRITERLIDGNYRVKGSQPFMIGPREYKVIVTGIIRAADFNEEGISATKLLDPKFDIVSVRRKESPL